MADIKNYGLKGIGDDVQLGKGGGRFVFNTGAVDFRVTTDGTTLAHIQVLTPVGDTDAATKLYVDDTAAGLDFKESVTCATTEDMGATYSSVGGTAGNGNFTGVPATIDGITLAEFDRVLVKNEADAKENGIYVVTSTTTTIERATDHDSDAEVSAGNFTFVEEGTVNADTGWVLQGPDPLAINTQDIDFVLFSTSGTLVAGVGLVKNGNLLDLDFSELASAATIATADELIFQDAGVESRITVANFLADRDIVTITSNGIVTRTADDTYAARTITASATATEEGLVVTNGDGVSGNPTIGLDIQGTTSAGTNAVDTDELILFDGTNNKAYSITELANAPAFDSAGTSIGVGDTSVTITDTGSDGTVTTLADGATVIVTTDAGTTFTVDSATTNADIPVIRVSATSTGTPVAGIGPSIEFLSETVVDNFEIGGLFALEATDVTGASEDFDFVFQLMAGGSAATEVARVTSLGGVEAASFTASSLTSGRVLLAGASGIIEDNAGLTYDGTNLDLSTSGRVRVGNNDKNSPAFSFSDETNTGVFKQGAGSLGISLAGAGNWLFQAASFFGNLSGGPQLMFEAATATNPTLVARLSDTDSGIGSAAADAISIIAGGTEAIRFTEASSSVLQASEANVGLTADVGSAQGNGVITSSYNVYSTVANAGDAATLPATFIVGTTVFVKNDGANSMDVFPASGDNAGAGTDTAVAVAAGESATFMGTLADATWSKLIVSPGLIPTTITVADESSDTTSFVSFFTAATGDLGPKTNSALTFNASTGQLGATSFIASSLTDNRVLIAGASGLIEDDANFTFDGSIFAVTAAVDVTGDLDVDNVNINGNTISITDTNGNVTIQPNGTGQITLANGSGEEILELQDTVDAINGLLITAGATGNPAQITTGTGSEANIDIGFLTNGTGVLTIASGSGNYEDNISADDDIPNKKYVDDQIQLTGGSGTLDSVTGTVDLATASVQNIGAATGIPQNATILSVTLDVTTISDAATTVTIGDATNGAASYMTASENDPEVQDIYIADGRQTNPAAAVQATATVAVNGTVGAATVIITFRHV